MVMAVYAKQYGRLGNNLFQKAAAIGFAMRHGLQYNLSGRTHFDKAPVLISEVGHEYNQLEYSPAWANRHILLDGYWQSERYFDHFREEVLKAFGYIRSALPRVCSVHVRRGDYLKYPDKHPVVTMDYLVQAMEMITQQREIESFMVFSDDLTWCIDQFAKLPYKFDYSTDHSEQEDMQLMSYCGHNIISNSTFSWWGAWLGGYSDKVVISPSKDNWFGPGNKHLDTSDLIPDSWIQIKY
jgi:hypothetical protein